MNNIKGSWRKHVDFRFLSGDDIANKTIELTVKSSSKEEIFNPKTNKKDLVLIIYFEETPKGIILNNKINPTAIERLLGTDKVEEWIGKKIPFYGKPDKVHDYVIRIKQDFSQVKV